MTSEALEALRAEIEDLETRGRVEIAKQIKTAREWGDLKENAEYHSAKEDQAHLETKIARLRGQLRSAAVVEVSGSSQTVAHGSTVSYTDRSTNRSQTFTIVSPYDAKPAEGALSVASPIAKALIGHGVGDVVEVQTPTGMRALEIESIS